MTARTASPHRCRPLCRRRRRTLPGSVHPPPAACPAGSCRCLARRLRARGGNMHTVRDGWGEGRMGWARGRHQGAACSAGQGHAQRA
eukprot:364027-Chlamydomonas_euryale.AAC.4